MRLNRNNKNNEFSQVCLTCMSCVENESKGRNELFACVMHPVDRITKLLTWSALPEPISICPTDLDLTLDKMVNHNTCMRHGTAMDYFMVIILAPCHCHLSP